MHPTLDIPRRHLDILPLVVALSAAVGRGDLGPSPHDDLILLGQEVGRLEVPGDDEFADRGPDDGDEAFDYVEPGFVDIFVSIYLPQETIHWSIGIQGFHTISTQASPLCRPYRESHTQGDRRMHRRGRMPLFSVSIRINN